MATFDPIRKFISIAVSDIVEAFNTLINEINERLGLIGQDTDAAIAAVAADLATHEADTNNPHSTTAHQVGTYTSAEIDGLVGSYGFQVYPSSAAVTVPAGIANGENYWVQSADGLTIISYTNNAGTPGVTPGVNPLPTDLGLQQAVLRDYTNAMYSAAGNGTVKALWDWQGPSAKLAGSTTILTSLTDLSPASLQLVLSGFIYTGTDPRPIYDPVRGIYLSSQAGFQIANGLLSKTSGDFGLIFNCDLDMLTGTVANVGSLPAGTEGSMYLVNADTNTIYTPDVVEVLDQPFSASELVNGYFRYNQSVATWQKGDYYLLAVKGVSSYLYLRVTHLGQVYAAVYNGAGAELNVHPIGQVNFGQANRLQFGLRRFANQLSLWCNGEMVCTIGMAGQASITDFSTTYINGNIRPSSTVNPVANGLRFYWQGLAVADDMTQPEWLRFYNTAAQRYRTPQIDVDAVLNILIGMGQSWFQGAIAVTDLYRTGPNNWNGQVTRNNLSHSGEQNTVTRQGFPNLLCSRGIDNPDEIGPYFVAINSLGNLDTTSTRSPNSSGENQMAGFMAQVNTFSQGKTAMYAMAGYGAGGATIATLAFQSVVPLMQNIKTVPLTASDYYNKVMRQVAYLVTYAQVRGWIPIVAGIVWDQGHSDLSNANYSADFLSLWDRFVLNSKQLTGQNSDPVTSIQQINYSVDGIGNRTNYTTSIDQQMLDIVANRGTRPIFLTCMPYKFTSFIHPYRLAHRWRGEDQGLGWGRVASNGEQYPACVPLSFVYAIGGTTVKVVFPVRGVGGLQFRTNANNIDALVVRNGVTTYGFTYYKVASVVTISVAAPGIVSWAAHGRAAGSKIQFSMIGNFTMPAPLTAYTTYYVVNPTTDNFQLALTPGGVPITTTAPAVGTITAFDISTYPASVAIGTTTVTNDSVTVTLDNPIQSGDVFQYAGWDCRYGNLFDGPAVDGIFNDQDWTVPFVSNEPPFTLGLKNDVSLAAAAFKKVLT